MKTNFSFLLMLLTSRLSFSRHNKVYSGALGCLMTLSLTEHFSSFFFLFTLLPHDKELGGNFVEKLFHIHREFLARVVSIFRGRLQETARASNSNTLWRGWEISMLRAAMQWKSWKTWENAVENITSVSSSGMWKEVSIICLRNIDIKVNAAIQWKGSNWHKPASGKFTSQFYAIHLHFNGVNAKSSALNYCPRFAIRKSLKCLQDVLGVFSEREFHEFEYLMHAVCCVGEATKDDEDWINSKLGKVETWWGIHCRLVEFDISWHFILNITGAELVRKMSYLTRATMEENSFHFLNNSNISGMKRKIWIFTFLTFSFAFSASVEIRCFHE